MGYEIIDTAELDPLPDRSATALELSDHYVQSGEPVTGESSRGPEKIGLRLYLAEPGESLGGDARMHYHEQQEEVFYVIEGTLHVETPEEEYEVEPRQALVVEPESPQRAYNPEDASATVEVLAIGAPSYRELGRSDGFWYDPKENEG